MVPQRVARFQCLVLWFGLFLGSSVPMLGGGDGSFLHCVHCKHQKERNKENSFMKVEFALTQCHR